ncbi:hypothetical protein ACFL6U_11670 [Planctomycetota bacterium]
MFSTIKIMTWAYARESRWRILGSLMGILCFAHLTGKEMADMDPMEALFAQYLLVLLIVLALTIQVIIQYTNKQYGLGFPPTLYIEPVSTWLLVTWRIGLDVLIANLLYGITVLVIYLHTDLRWPMLGPCLLITLVVTFMQATLWSCTRIPGLHILIGGVLILLFINGYSRCYGVTSFLVGIPHHPWAANAAMDHIIRIAGIVCATMLSITAVSSDRCGDGLCLHWQRSQRSAPTTRPCPQTRPFRSARMAQVWFEQHRIGWIVPGCNLFVAALILLLCFSNLSNTKIPDNCAAFFWVFAIVNLTVYPPLLGLTLGVQGKGRLVIDPFKAIQPISNASLLWTQLLTAIKTMLVGWGIYFACLLIVLIALMTTQGRAALDQFFATLRVLSQTLSEPDSPWYSIRFVLSLRGLWIVCMWTAFTLSATLLLTGRGWFLITMGILLWGLPIAWSLPGDLGLVSSNIATGMRHAQTWIIGLGCLGLTVAAHALVRKKSRIHRLVPWLGLGLWIALFSFSVYGDIVTSKSSLTHLTCVAGLLALPVLPLAAAPLALAWNRHR